MAGSSNHYHLQLQFKQKPTLAVILINDDVDKYYYKKNTIPLFKYIAYL